MEYEAAGIEGYWLIDPLRERAESYQLDEEGFYRRVLPEAGGVYHSQAVPGFWLEVECLWQEPLLKVLDVLRDMQLI